MKCIYIPLFAAKKREEGDDPPVRDKEELLRLHDEAIEQGCIGDCFR